jgi:hypothetical protein
MWIRITTKVALILFVGTAILARTGGGPHGMLTPARATGIGPPPPPVHAYPAMYHSVGGRWQATRTLRQGDLARFTLRFRLDAPGWSFPHAHLILRRAFIDKRGRKQYRGTVFVVGMMRAQGRHGFTRFWVNIVVPRRLYGLYLAEFHVTVGTEAGGGGNILLRVVHSAAGKM